MSLDDVKREVALGSRILSITGLASGVRASMGHVSLRDPSDPNRFVVKGRGYKIDVLSRMTPENMVVCDLNGYLLDGPPGVRPVQRGHDPRLGVQGAARGEFGGSRPSAVQRDDDRRSASRSCRWCSKECASSVIRCRSIATWH